VFLAPERKLIPFEFHPGRAHDVPQDILKDFKCVLQTDGLSSYTAAFKDNEEATLMSCVAHIRMGFKKAQKQNKALADEVLTYFTIIYKIEAYAQSKQMNEGQRLDWNTGSRRIVRSSSIGKVTASTHNCPNI